MKKKVIISIPTKKRWELLNKKDDFIIKFGNKFIEVKMN